MRRAALGLAACLPLAACVQEIPLDEVLTSLRLTLSEPRETDLGREGKPVTPAQVQFDLQAIGPRGELVRRDYQTQAFLAAGGGRLSLVSPCSASSGADMGQGAGGDPGWLLGRIPLKGGEAKGVRIPLASRAIFGQVALNVEEPGTLAIGATPPVYFPNPTIARLMEPWDPDARDASYCSPYLGRQVSLDGPAGKLIVTSVFKNGFGLTDSSTPDYSSVFVFTFSQPRPTVVKGRLMNRVSGSIAKFNGLTQVANVNYDTGAEVRPDLLPAPVEITADRRRKLGTGDADRTRDLEQNKWLLKRVGAVVRVKAKVCDTNDQFRGPSWQNYSTFVVTFDPDMNPALDGCDNRKTFSVQLPGRGFAGFDPDAQKGRDITVTGMLQNSASATGALLFWTIAVRDAQDLALN